MATKEDVESFLGDLRAKLSVYTVFYYDREKNKKALLDLEITSAQRDELIRKLRAEDYFSGPKSDTNDTGMPDYWEFGITVKDQQVYIKISIGKHDKPVIWISFHIAEREIKHPFK